MGKLMQVSTKLDAETIEAVRAYSALAGHSGMFETYRELIIAGLHAKTEGSRASVVRQQVREELEVFMSGLQLRLELMAMDVADDLDARLSSQVDAVSVAASATMRIASETAAAQPGEDRSPEEIRADALSGIWEVSSRLLSAEAE